MTWTFDATFTEDEHEETRKRVAESNARFAELRGRGVSTWTDEQIQNILLYGKCRICGAPREHAQGERKNPNGTTVMWSGLVCPNDHSGEWPLERDDEWGGGCVSVAEKLKELIERPVGSHADYLRAANELADALSLIVAVVEAAERVAGIRSGAWPELASALAVLDEALS